jgi:hypothetical protein
MNTTTNEILFIDANVSDAQSLIDGLSSDIEIVLLDDKTNVLNQIAAVLDRYQKLDAIHIISHGAEGELAFANGALNNTNVNHHPEVGDFFIFPAKVRHCVSPFKSKGIRISLAANFKLL